MNAVSQLVKIAVDGDFDDYIVQVSRDKETVELAFETLSEVVEEEETFASKHLIAVEGMTPKEKGAYMKTLDDKDRKGALSSVIFKGGSAEEYAIANTKFITKVAMFRLGLELK